MKAQTALGGIHLNVSSKALTGLPYQEFSSHKPRKRFSRRSFQKL
jgi:hypothetical protein